MLQDQTKIPQSLTKVILTVPYVPVFDDNEKTRKRGESAVTAFSQALALAVGAVSDGNVLILMEEKIENKVAVDGIQRLAENEQGEILLCDEFETVGRWYRGIRKAFNEGCEKVLVLALENLTKGLLIGRNPNAVGPHSLDLKLLVNSKGGHDLSKLAQQAAPYLSPVEIDLVNRLVAFVGWAGKYPIHLRANETNHPSFKTTDPELIDKMFEKFIGILKNENPTPTVGFA